MDSSNPLTEVAKRLPGNWLQGSYADPDGVKHCGKGHLIEVFSEHGESLYGWNYTAASDLMDKVATEQFPERSKVTQEQMCAFVNFNDHEDTIEDDVVAVIEKAAVRWDERI